MSGRLCFIVESGSDVRLVEGLAEKFELTILARKIEGGVEINHAPSMPVPVVVGSASRFGFAWQVFRHLLARRGEVDFIIVQGYGMAALAANIAARLTGSAAFMLVCSPVEAYYLCRKKHPAPDKIFRRRELWGLRVLARLNGLVGGQYIVLSDYLTGVVRRHGSSLPVHVIPVYGVDTEVFSPPAEDKHALRARLGLPATGALIFFSSRIAPEKDGETLLEAVRQLLDAKHDLWLLHLSGGHMVFKQDAARFGIGERVIALDAVHPHGALPRIYQASDICVQASREEGLGFSPLEALACGVPVVAAEVGGLRETIVDDQTGWTYPAGDARALARCIEVALGNPDEAARRTALGRSLVAARFERRIVFEQLAQVVRRRQNVEAINSTAG